MKLPGFVKAPDSQDIDLEGPRWIFLICMSGGICMNGPACHLSSVLSFTSLVQGLHFFIFRKFSESLSLFLKSACRQ